MRHVFCVKVPTGPAIVLHIMVAMASVLFRVGRDPRVPPSFDKHIWKAIGMTGSQVQVLLQSLFRQCNISQVLTLTEVHSRLWSHNVHGRC